MLLCAILVTPIFFAGWISSEWLAVISLGLAAAAHQGWSANLLTTTSDMFPRSVVGVVTGVGGTACSIGGVLFSLSAGWVLQLMHSYTPLFAISACAYLIALAALRLLAPACARSKCLSHRPPDNLYILFMKQIAQCGNLHPIG